MGTNNSINNAVTDNDFSVNQDTAGTASVASANHSDNSNTSSHASFLAESGGASGGDAFVRLNIPSGQDYSLGIDNSDSDVLKITDDADPSTGTTLWEMSSEGECTLPEQTAFLAYQLTTDSNVTGSGGNYFVGTNTAMTEIVDRNGDFSPGGAAAATFTAPVSGIYRLCYTVNFVGLTSAMVRFFSDINTSNQDLRCEDVDAGNQAGSSNGYATSLGMLAEMDAADTSDWRVRIQSGAGNTADIQGDISSTYISTIMSAFLVC